jgi:hypothetical protein
MNTGPQSGVARALADKESSFASDPERASVVGAARRFKASWFELGEALSRVRREERYKGWGYSSFEDYCRKELHIRQETADKLTGSFSFLRSRAPQVVERAFSHDPSTSEEPLPTYQAIDFWRRAEETEVPRDTVAEIRRQVLDEGATLPRLNRQFREVVFPLDDATRSEKRRTELRTATARIIELLAHARDEGLVPAQLSAELEEPLQRLAVHVQNEQPS